jgi:homocysteine S-methyltransferase
LDWKIDAGAEYMITQPVFDIKVFEYFLNKIQHIKVPIIAGLWPLTSLRNAEFMNNEVPGCIVPEEIMDRLRKVEDSKDDSRKVGVEIAYETLNMIKPMIKGVQISAPFGNVKSVLDVLS